MSEELSVPTFTSNGAWAQYAGKLLGSDGADSKAAAIAKYLCGRPLTQVQAAFAEMAIAVANFPPVNPVVQEEVSV